MKLPVSIVVAEVLSGRYHSGSRPDSWDQRVAGHDLVRTKDGEVIKLSSDGQQATPAVGWGLILMDGDNHNGYSWTLYSTPFSLNAVAQKVSHA